MNAEQAKFLTEFLTGVLERESAATAKVLAAVPDSGRDYKPDPKSRTAWELATHLALLADQLGDCVCLRIFVHSDRHSVRLVLLQRLDGRSGALFLQRSIHGFYFLQFPPLRFLLCGARIITAV